MSSVVVKHMMKPQCDPEKHSIEQIRQTTRALLSKTKLPQGTVTQKIDIQGLPAEWIQAGNVSGEQRKTILYFHSGGFCLEYSNAHRDFASKVSSVSRVRVLAIDYRLAPENPYPAANEDCLKAYQWLLEQGVPPENIVIGGDSAGGGLAMMTLLSLRDMGIPLPAAAFVLSPMGLDLTRFDGETYIEKARADPLNTLACIKLYAKYYVGSSAIQLPIFLEQDLHGFPNLLIQVGSNEVLLSDSIRLSERATSAGVDVTLEIWKNMWHVFQMFSSVVPEAKQSIDKIGDFVRKNLHKRN
jgi:acetyl esterase/lipase